MSAAAQHVRLGVDGRDGRSTIVDAIAVLRAEAGFREHDTATIRVGILRLPSAEQVGLVEAVFDAPWADTVYRVPLRTAARFSGRIQGSAKQVDFDVIRLNRAKVDIHGTVTLADKTTTLYAVEVSRAPEMTNPTKLDWRIIHAALKVIPGGEQCYRSLAEGASFAVPEVISNERVLDCDSLRWLKPPPLKEIVAGVRRVDPELSVSDEKISQGLRKFGLRAPKPRPRKAPRTPKPRKPAKV